MMRKKRFLRDVAVVFAGCILLCLVVTGCGARDSAMVISIGETMEADAVEQSTTEEARQTIWVYVCGAVVNPGVYELFDNARVNDALQAAGGFAEDAGKEYVNLAAVIADGEQLYFPTAWEAEALKQAAEKEQQDLVNINTATEVRLMELPGIGEAKARDIIAYREEYGDFQRKEDLMKVPGIKENMYAKLCDRIIVQ